MEARRAEARRAGGILRQYLDVAILRIDIVRDCC